MPPRKDNPGRRGNALQRLDKSTHPLTVFKGAGRVKMQPKEIREKILGSLATVEAIINGEMKAPSKFLQLLADEFAEKPLELLRMWERTGKAMPDVAVTINVPGSNEPQSFGAIFDDGKRMAQEYEMPITSIEELMENE